MHKSTKIIASIGPSSDKKDVMRHMHEHGMNIIRLNCSHGSHGQFSKIIDTAREISDELGILLDTKGPEVRTGKSGSQLILKAGQKVTVADRQYSGGDWVAVKYPYLREIPHGTIMRIDDGMLSMQIIAHRGKELEAKVIDGGELLSNKSVAIQGYNVRLPFLSSNDRKDIAFGRQKGVDFIAASFVRRKEDVHQLRKLAKDQMLISKIEHWKAVENLKEIINVSDGIMVARGDLGAQLSLEKVPKLQAEIIRECNLEGKPVIVATQMLESMREHPRPTRAEVSDVAQAILQGADAIMLSGETTIGKYPVQAVQMMSKIAHEYDKQVRSSIPPNLPREDIALFVTEAAYQASAQLNVKAILTPTETGFTARNVSRFKPKVPILAMTRSDRVFRQLQLSWGVMPMFTATRYSDMGKMIRDMVLKSSEKGFVEHKDNVVITAGHGLRGSSNMLEIHNVGDILKSK